MGLPAGREWRLGGPLASAAPARPPSERRQVGTFSLFPARPERRLDRKGIKTRLVCKTLSLQTCPFCGAPGRPPFAGWTRAQPEGRPPLHLGARGECPLEKLVLLSQVLFHSPRRPRSLPRSGAGRRGFVPRSLSL